MDRSHSSKKIFDENNIISLITRFPYPLHFFISALLILPFRGTQLKVCRRNTTSRGREDRFERDSSREKRGSQCRIDFTSGYIFLRPFERGLRGQCIFNCADYSEWLLTAECVCIIPQRSFSIRLLFMEKARIVYFLLFFSPSFSTLSRDRYIIKNNKSLTVMPRKSVLTILTFWNRIL